MNTPELNAPLLAAFVLLLLSSIAARVQQPRRKADPQTFKPKRPLTQHEQAMYWRLLEAFPHPQHVVLAQVGFGALLSSTDGTNLNQFTEKRADFVLLDESFRPLAVIGLDDPSRKIRAWWEGSKRDKLLKGVGYTVLRYHDIPKVSQLQAAVQGARTARGERSGGAAARKTPSRADRGRSRGLQPRT